MSKKLSTTCRNCGGEMTIEFYINPCNRAGCNFNTGEHAACGQQERWECECCGWVEWDSADDGDWRPKTKPKLIFGKLEDVIG